MESRCNHHGQRMLLIIFATEILPIKILQPTGHNRFIGLVERMFEIKQTDHQTRADSGPTDIASVTRIDFFFDLRPIDFIRQDNEWMFVIKNFREFSAEQFAWRVGVFGFHNLPENESIRDMFWQIAPQISTRNTPMIFGE
jgi:hypothetical protein